MTEQDAFRIAFVAGVSPDKWVRRWRERTPDSPLELELVDDAEQRAVLDDGRAAMAFVRLPVERDGLHLIPLYVEVPVVVLPKEHELTLLDELTLDDLAGEQLVTDPADLPGFAEVTTVERLAWPAMGPRDAVEVVASGGAIAVLPMSVARLHHRKDVTTRPLVDGPESAVGLAWLRQNDDPRIETFVGIVRGRTAQSSRGAEGDAAAKPAARDTPHKAPSRKPQSGKAQSGKAQSGTKAQARKQSGARRTSGSPKRRGR